MDAEKELQTSEFSYRIYLLFFLGLFIVAFYCVLCFAFRHTYQLPVSSPGVLVSDWWSWNFVREWLLWTYLLMIFSGHFMRLSRTRSGVVVHMVLLFGLFVWAMIVFSFDLSLMANANAAPSSGNFDPSSMAHDPRYCCVYGGQPGTELYCAIDIMVNACPAIAATQLGVNYIFLLRFAVNLMMAGFFIYDFIVTWNNYLPLLNQHLKNKTY
jgi:hypothetical protein